jgi:nucleotide-binding universal stress UspA family protein
VSDATVDAKGLRPTGSEALFSRIVVGVDDSDASREAVRQAAALVDDDGSLTLLSVYDVAPTSLGGTGMGAPVYYDPEAQRAATQRAPETPREEIGDRIQPGAKSARGRAWEALIREVGDDHTALIAVGSRGTSRAAGIVLGSTPTEVVHKAPCSVLIARAVGAPAPRKIVVGVDGSPESGAAYSIALQLASRFSAELWPVVSHGGKGADRQKVEMIVDRRYEELQDEPVQALLAAAADAELVVVGSRGLHGLKALGSVSERVAHQAHVSVLVVRGGHRRH